MLVLNQRVALNKLIHGDTLDIIFLVDSTCIISSSECVTKQVFPILLKYLSFFYKRTFFSLKIFRLKHL